MKTSSFIKILYSIKELLRNKQYEEAKGLVDEIIKTNENATIK